MPATVDRLIIRPASCGDLDQIVALHLSLASHCDDLMLDPATVRAGISAMLANKLLGETFIASIFSEAVGMIEVKTLFEPWWNQEYWWIDNVAVRHGLRGQGIGKLLVEHVEQLARQRDIPYLRLFVNDDNTDGFDFWSRTGFLRKGQLLERRL